MSLNKEISKKIVANLGFAPSSMPEIGLRSKDLLLDKQLKIQDNNKINLFHIYSGSIHTEQPAIITISNIGTKQDPEIVAQIFDIYALKFDWSDSSDEGILLTKTEDLWLKSSLIERLEVLLLLEKINYTGLLWNKTNKEVYDNFISVVEILEEN